MRFEVSSETQLGVFHTVPIQGDGTYVLLPTKPFPPTDDLWVNDFNFSKAIDSFFTIGMVGLGGYADFEEAASGYLFHSKLPVINYGTAVMAYSEAVRQSARFRVKVEETTAVFRNQHFYVYTAKSIGTLITCGDVSEELNSFLTMI
jgi:hypothetical protein